MKVYKLITTYVISSLAMLPYLVFAIGEGGPGGGSGGSAGIYKNPLGDGTTNFSILITKVLGVLIDIGIPLLVLFIVFAGFKYITAQGNETKVTEAHKALWWSLVGGAVLIGAEIIQRVVESTIKAIGGA